MKKHLILLSIIFISGISHAQYNGEVYMKKRGDVPADTLEAEISINQSADMITVLDDSGTPIIYDGTYVIGFKITDQFFYEKPEYYFLPKQADKKVLYEVKTRGRFFWHLQKDKEIFVYDNSQDKIFKIDNEGDLKKRLPLYKEIISPRISKELWNWRVDLTEMIDYYNQNFM